MLRIGDIVFHVDYPGQKGRVVGHSHEYDSIKTVMVLWSSPQPHNIFGRLVNSSRHIPSALRRVQN